MQPGYICFQFYHTDNMMPVNAPSIQSSTSFRNIKKYIQPTNINKPSPSEPSVKSGWLRKEGGVIKSWHRRWFTIKGDFMYYYAAQDEQKLLGHIPLAGNHVKEIPHVIAEPDKFHFEIVPGKCQSIIIFHPLSDMWWILFMKVIIDSYEVHL